MKCPYRKITKTDVLTNLTKITEEYMDCYEEECPLFDAKYRICDRADNESREGKVIVQTD